MTKHMMNGLRSLKSVYFSIADRWDIFSGVRSPTTPPARIFQQGSYETFLASGREYFTYLVDLCGLSPTDIVLDVGCGAGCKAIPLLDFLDKSGRYDGFDIRQEAIDWCQKNVTTRHSNFRFHLARVNNKHYGVTDRKPASKYRFPFPEETFDIVILSSVFTHMFPEDVDNYFANISRVLKVGGRALITYFLLTDESKQLISDGRSRFTFPHNYDGYAVRSTESEEGAIAYDINFVVDLYKKHQLKIEGDVHYGSWCGRKEYLSDQDVVISFKRRSLVDVIAGSQ
ncbi:MAG: class I SAM-dependent methyltransferase [Gammaproteobacteria bacterium]|nr:class I SAM-dependent methyltransferase [Gammaproteobacteria bacterium]